MVVGFRDRKRERGKRRLGFRRTRLGEKREKEKNKPHMIKHKSFI